MRPAVAPEQVIGQSLLTMLRLKRIGLRIHERPQAVGSATVAALRDAGYTIVPTEHLRVIEDGNDRMDDQIERLRAWKAEATEVITQWEQVWEALGCPGRLGESKAGAVLRMVADDLRELLDSKDQPHEA